MMAASEAGTNTKNFMETLLELGRHPNARIVRELSDGPRRYNELLAALSEFAEPLIGANLRALDGDGLVNRRVDPGPPFRVLYELTLLGQQLAPGLSTIESWAHAAQTPAAPAHRLDQA